MRQVPLANILSGGLPGDRRSCWFSVEPPIDCNCHPIPTGGTQCKVQAADSSSAFERISRVRIPSGLPLAERGGHEDASF